MQITHICQYTYTANLKRTIVLPTQRHGSSISSHNNHCIYGSDRIAHSSNIYDATHSPNISFITSYNTYSCTHFTRYICATIRSMCVCLPRIRRGHHHPHSQCGTFRLFGPKFRHIYVVRFCLWCTIESKSKTHPCTDSQTLYLRSDAIFFPRSVSSFAGAWSLGWNRLNDWNRNYTQPINTHTWARIPSYYIRYIEWEDIHIYTYKNMTHMCSACKCVSYACISDGLCRVVSYAAHTKFLMYIRNQSLWILWYTYS